MTTRGFRRTFAVAAALAAACSGAKAPQPAPVAPNPNATSTSNPNPTPAGPVTITVLGTNDVHGHLESLPLLSSYVAAVRAARARDGGAVILLDGGDAFQGTIESNLNEGAAIIAAYNAIGYTAMALGNHEFDFGPAGPLGVPKNDEDPRGALKARAAEAKFPLLGANVVGAEDGAPFTAPNVAGTTTVEVAGVTVGIIGLATLDTPRTTMSANFKGLSIAPPDEIARREARRLREAGADVVLVTAHAGGRCASFDDPKDLSVCEPRQEIFQVANAMEPGLVDVIVAGHTHAGVAHEVNGTAIIESFKHGQAFGRVDLTVDPASGKVTAVKIHRPQNLVPGVYEGVELVPDPRITKMMEPFVQAAKQKREESLGVKLRAPVTRAHGEESALGNLFTDLMLEARKGDVAITNGGGLRIDLPAGELTYGALFEASPFDNRFAIVAMDGGDLRRIVRENLERSNGIFSVSGVTVTARCKGPTLEVELRRGKKLVKDADPIVVVTSDFLATGGDGAFSGLPDGAVKVEDGDPIRDVMAALLVKKKGELDPAKLYDPKKPRITYPGKRPVRCAE